MEIIALDSQIFKSYKACKRMCKFQFIDKLEPLVKEDYFDRGTLIHKMLAFHYKLVRHNFHATPPTTKRFPYEKIVQIVTQKGNRISMSLDLAPEECIRAIEVYKEYAEYYQGEDWVPIHVETPFSLILHQDDDLTILWEGVIDLMNQHGVVDTKTSERRGEPRSLDEQFIGYCWAMKCNNIVVNKVGFQTSLKPELKFERYTKSYPKSIIEEWRQDVIRVVKKSLLEDVKESVPGVLAGTMYQEYNYTACQKWGCRYYPVCDTEPDIRDWKIKQLYKSPRLVQTWAPGEVLEATR